VTSASSPRKVPWLLVVFAVALGVRLAHVHETVGTPGWFWHTSEKTGMLAQSPVVMRIRSGDLAAANPTQPLQAWQRAAGPPAAWQALCGRSLQDPPGGYYLRAFGGMAVGGSLYGHKVLLALLGALACAAIGGAVTALAGSRAGFAAGIVAAFYSPFIAADGVLRGDVPALGLIALGVALAARPPGSDARRDAWRVAGAGAAFALAVSLRGIAWIPLAVVLAWLIARVVRGRVSRKIPALFAAGVFAACLPFGLRDLAAGAPPLAPPCAAVASFAVEERLLGAEPPVLPASRISALAGGIAWRLANPRVLADNFLAAASEVEPPDSDFSFEYLRQHSTVLFLFPRYSWLLMFAVLAAGVWAWRMRAEGRPAGERAGLVIALFAASVIVLAFAGPSARMRLPLLLPLFAGAGWFLAWVWDACSAREWPRVSRAAAAVLAARLVWLAVPPPAALHRAEVRLDDFVVGGFLLAERGDLEAVDKELGRAWNLLLSRTPPEDAMEVGLKLRKAHLLVFFRYGTPDSLVEDWDVLHKAIPDDPLVQEVGRVLGKAP
jgi:hypothetical protein